jgi:hypothetical protein
MMKRKVLFLAVAVSICATLAHAGTVAYWRFEEGPDGAQVSHGGLPDGEFYPGVVDVSGSNNNLSVWNESWAGYVYRSETAYSKVPLNGFENNYSVKNSGGYPAMWTDSSSSISKITPAAFTIEATFKLENGGYKTIVGRDSRGSVTQGENPNADLAALYFQTVPNNGLAIKFCDVSGYWHEAIAPENSYIGFDWGTDPDGEQAPWYSMAAVSDGATLSLYLIQIGSGEGWKLIAQTDLTASGSPNTALTAGTGDGNDWDAGNWTVGRGLYAGGHGDRGYGYIDEVRISDSALSVSEFLVPEPATLVILGLGGLGLLKRRTR